MAQIYASFLKFNLKIKNMILKAATFGRNCEEQYVIIGFILLFSYRLHKYIYQHQNNKR